MSELEDKGDAQDRWLNVLLAMHAYNDSSGRHHEESGRRTANIFILIYFFLFGVIIANGLNIISLLVAIFLTVFARIGYNLASGHARIAGMHFWRNKQIRDQFDLMFDKKITIAAIFAQSRRHFGSEINEYGYTKKSYHGDWAKVHQLIIVIGLLIMILTAVNQYSCLSKNGCLWAKGNETTITLVGPLKDLIGRLLPSH